MRRSPSLVLVLLAACASDPEAPVKNPPDGTPRQPEGWDRALALSTLEDLDPDPNIVEHRLHAKISPVEIEPGRVVNAWTYAGTLPGPLIRVKKGDRLIVHFTHELPEPTTIHWHGIRLPANMDGTPGHSQPEVVAGGEFTYDFVVPDAGLYWYHPHVSSAAQVGFGLYGALLVEDEAEAVDADELVLVLSDLELKPDDSLADPQSGGDIGTLFGREGGVVLVNGKHRPELRARSGAPQRWRIVNAAKSRYFQLELAGHTFRVIGNDGGRMGSELRRDRVVLTPGERLEVLVTPAGAPGSSHELRWIPYDRGYGSTEFRDPEVILDLKLDAAPQFEAEPITIAPTEITPLSIEGATPVWLRLTQGQDAEGKLVLGINGLPHWEAPPIHARIGETQLWTVENTMDWSHPFHLHGYFFQVIDDEGRPIPPLGWRDTVDVPFQQTVRFLVRFDDRPGMWMYHCHVLDHADGGMMGMLMVMD